MIIVGETLVSEDILEEYFNCHLDKCKGACCISGDRGAPLDPSELDIIAGELDKIKPFMDTEGLELLEQNGFHELDPSDGEIVTTCRSDGACVFVVMEDGKTQCAIEKSFYAGKTKFKKPVSCHLYPIRAAKYGEYTVMNYNRWDICKSGCELGAELKKPLYRFLEGPLIRKMGKEWYDELELIAENWKIEKKR